MNSQIDKNIEELTARKLVDDMAVANYLEVINMERLRGEKDTGDHYNKASSLLNIITHKLATGERLALEEKSLVLEILSNVTKLLRVYGRRSPGLEAYITNFKETRDVC